MDKNASWFEGLGSLGFGSVEVGTLTANPQQGNPKPRVHRLVEDRALLNSMGFPNPGAEAAQKRLQRRTGETVVGVNVGKSKDVPAEHSGEDYRAALKHVAALCDFLVLNVSSPNTPGQRALQGVTLLRGLLDDVQAELAEQGLTVPLLIKISPDLAPDEIDAIADLAMTRGIAGIIAVNTTTSRDGLASDPEVLQRPGGVSGAPLKVAALQVLERLYARSGHKLVLISVGGIESGQDAWERICAGATLVQAHTGFVYGGPLWPRRVNAELSELVRRSGARSIQDCVGMSFRESIDQTHPAALASA